MIDSAYPPSSAYIPVDVSMNSLDLGEFAGYSFVPSVSSNNIHFCGTRGGRCSVWVIDKKFLWTAKACAHLASLDSYIIGYFQLMPWDLGVRLGKGPSFSEHDHSLLRYLSSMAKQHTHV